jgi:hypothetical protein
LTKEREIIMKVNGFGTPLGYQPKTTTKGIGFAEQMEKATNKTAMDSLLSDLKSRFGFKDVAVKDVSSKEALKDYFNNTTGVGNVTIAPNVIQDMLNDPAKKAKIERDLLAHKSWLADAIQAESSTGETVNRSGLIIGPDGKVSEWIEVTPAIGGDAKILKKKEENEKQDAWWMGGEEKED